MLSLNLIWTWKYFIYQLQSVFFWLHKLCSCGHLFIHVYNLLKLINGYWILHYCYKFEVSFCCFKSHRLEIDDLSFRAYFDVMLYIGFGNLTEWYIVSSILIRLILQCWTVRWWSRYNLGFGALEFFLKFLMNSTRNHHRFLFSCKSFNYLISEIMFFTLDKLLILWRLLQLIIEFFLISRIKITCSWNTNILVQSATRFWL